MRLRSHEKKKFGQGEKKNNNPKETIKRKQERKCEG